MTYFQQINQQKIVKRMHDGLGLSLLEQNKIRQQQRGPLKRRIKIFLSRSFVGQIVIRCYKVSLLPRLLKNC